MTNTNLEKIAGYIETVSQETGINAEALRTALGRLASLEVRTFYETPKAIEGFFYGKMVEMFSDTYYEKKVSGLSIEDPKIRQLAKDYSIISAECLAEAIENPDDKDKRIIAHDAGNVFMGLFRNQEKLGLDRIKLIKIYDRILQSRYASREFLGEEQYHECVLKRVKGTQVAELIEKYH